ncbi:uncharacterized protein EAF02_008848 [Botrytis sinoallii]|uniref:uncharacterized protein n=1 Tax=Botrytis sinoallii TaxID=1463999 RepID=UPI0019017D72|nr:uncharacterized protein EAF02_008848 [Botrytis sinoallii]KAF7872777.1 hypothetical protein EAF02_008848 [Botrytis sinoallii]
MKSLDSPKLFTEDWIITIPSHPHLRFIRLIPSRYDHLVRIFSNPLNDPNNRTPDDTSWKESDSLDLIKTYTQRFSTSKTSHNALALLVEENGKIVGIGLMHEFEHQPRFANIGTILEEAGRSHGVGKILMELLLRLSCELNVDVVEAGTMKKNAAMRGLMRSLGIEELEEEKIMPGNRKVADIMFKDIERQRWRDFEIHVEFLGEVN